MEPRPLSTLSIAELDGTHIGNCRQVSGARMQVELVNGGPVTIVLASREVAILSTPQLSEVFNWGAPRPFSLR
jgi:hypothetical protein